MADYFSKYSNPRNRQITISNRQILEEEQEYIYRRRVEKNCLKIKEKKEKRKRSK